MYERLTGVLVGEAEFLGAKNLGLVQLLEVARELGVPLLNPEIVAERPDLSTINWQTFDNAKVAFGELTYFGRFADRALGEISGRKIPFLPLARGDLVGLLGLEILGTTENFEPVFYYETKQQMYSRVVRFLDKVKSEEILTTNPEVIYEDLIIDFKNMRVTEENKVIDLAALEFKLLSFLALSAGYTKSWREIMLNVWGVSDVNEGEKDRLGVVTHRLRKKIDPDRKYPKYIFTVRGVGLRFGTEVITENDE